MALQSDHEDQPVHPPFTEKKQQKKTKNIVSKQSENLFYPSVHVYNTYMIQVYPKGAICIKLWLENESKPIIIF